MPPNSPVGQATANIGSLKLPPAIACAPSPYALRRTMVMCGTVRLAPVTNSRLQWRTSAVFSTSGPTIMPGVSHSTPIGSPSMRMNAVTMPSPNSGRSSNTAPVSESVSITWRMS